MCPHLPHLSRVRTQASGSTYAALVLCTRSAVQHARSSPNRARSYLSPERMSLGLHGKLAFLYAMAWVARWQVLLRDQARPFGGCSALHTPVPPKCVLKVAMHMRGSRSVNWGVTYRAVRPCFPGPILEICSATLGRLLPGCARGGQGIPMNKPSTGSCGRKA